MLSLVYKIFCLYKNKQTPVEQRKREGEKKKAYFFKGN